MKQINRIITMASALLLSGSGLTLFSTAANAAVQPVKTPMQLMEKLDRAPVAVPAKQGNFVSWRLLGTDSRSTVFTLLRNGKPIAERLRVTNFLDAGGNAASEYSVAAYCGDKQTDISEAIKPWADIYNKVKLDRPASGTDYGYFPQESSVADADGDGRLELLVKWCPSNNQDNSNSGKTAPTIFDCYKPDGTKMWRVNLGENIRSGSHYTQFLFYDFNGDGRAELVCKTAPGSTDGTGQYVSAAATDESIKKQPDDRPYANKDGHIMQGAEYLTVFDGQTGRALHTVWYNPNRGFGCGEPAAYSELWGDTYGNRGERYLACVAYLDGADHNPSAVMCRGYYTRSYLWAVDFDGSRLSTHWLHASTSSSTVKVTDAAGQETTYKYNSNTSGLTRSYTAYGQGCHNISVADVDGDGADEIIYGSAAINNDGTLLYTTGLGHGDAQHLSDLMPDRPGLEFFMIHEDAPYGFSVRDAATGELLQHVTGTADTGRGMAADYVADKRGFEFWSAASYNVYDNAGNVFSDKRPSFCFRIYWDGDAQDELLDGVKIDDYTGGRIMNFGDYGHSSAYGSKAYPVLAADIMGDWREEVILFDKQDSASINIFSTTIPTKLRVPTLLHDHTYRMGVAWQNVAYNQPAHLGYYLPDSVAPHFTPAEGCSKEQTVEPGCSIVPVVCSLDNCDGAMLRATYLNGELIKSFMAPDGFTFTVDRENLTFTLSGTPQAEGLYEFVIKSSGDHSGESLQDTIRINVTRAASIVEMPAGTSAETELYTLGGTKVSNIGTMGRGIYIERKGTAIRKTRR